METSKTPALCSSRKPGIHDWAAPVGIPSAVIADYVRTNERLWRESIEFLPQPLYLHGYRAKHLYYGPFVIIDDRMPEPIYPNVA